MLVFYGFIAYILYAVIRFFNTLGKGGNATPQAKQVSGMMVKDDVCGTYLPKEEALTEKEKGHVYYFCSQECRRKFLESAHTRKS